MTEPMQLAEARVTRGLSIPVLAVALNATAGRRAIEWARAGQGWEGTPTAPGTGVRLAQAALALRRRRGRGAGRVSLRFGPLPDPGTSPAEALRKAAGEALEDFMAKQRVERARIAERARARAGRAAPAASSTRPAR